jgi:hypothetical protein
MMKFAHWQKEGGEEKEGDEGRENEGKVLEW